MSHQTYFDTLKFAEYLLGLMVMRWKTGEFTSARLCAMIRKVTPYEPDPDEVARVVEGKRAPSVPLWLAINDTLQPDGGMLHYFAPAVDPRTIENVNALRKEIEAA